MLLKQLLRSAFPLRGAIWEPKPGGGFDRLLSGMADASRPVFDFLSDIFYLRSPELSEYIEDMEAEYGIEENTRLTDSERRQRVRAIQTAGSGTGAYDFLERQITAAGFPPLEVEPNDPPVDPVALLTNLSVPGAVHGAVESVHGAAGAVHADPGGDIVLVNGDTSHTEDYDLAATRGLSPSNDGAPPPDPQPYGMAHGSTTGVHNGPDAVHGIPGEFDPLDFSDVTARHGAPGVVHGSEGAIHFANASPIINYQIRVFFVAGSFTRGPSGEITGVAPGEIPASRRTELEQIIVRHKPMHTWCVVFANYV